MKQSYDAIVVGSGPNGLAAAITLARAGLSVLVLEAAAVPGGGLKTEPLTLPGFSHDVCSSIHPLAVASPFFRSLNLGIEWIHPKFPLSHPLDHGRAGWLQGPQQERADDPGEDTAAYRRLLEPFVKHYELLLDEVLQPMLHRPKHLLLMAGFGALALRSAEGLAHHYFRTDTGQALFAGLAAHSFLPLDKTASAAMGLVLGILARAAGWPMPRGGSGKIAEAMAGALLELGGEIETGHRVASLAELPPARAVLLDVSPQQLLQIAGPRLPARYCAALKKFRPGPGVFKIDYALNAPIPWAAEACRGAGTVHIGGTLGEIALAERQVVKGEIPERPFVLLAQHSLFDSTRAPAGKHTAWAYCHVPNGSAVDMTDRIETQIERFAPGFRDCILARSTLNCRALEDKNPNLHGGDIGGGLASLGQLLARPVLSPVPYRTPARGIYLCSASTPPGGGVHGMCGYHAARAALKSVFRFNVENYS